MRKEKFDDLTDQEREWFIEAKEAFKIGDEETFNLLTTKLGYTVDILQVGNNYEKIYNTKSTPKKPASKISSNKGNLVFGFALVRAYFACL